MFMAFMTNAKLQVFALIAFAYFGSLDVPVATEIAGRASVIDADTINPPPADKTPWGRRA
jgi:hypothetical protein